MEGTGSTLALYGEGWNVNGCTEDRAWARATPGGYTSAAAIGALFRHTQRARLDCARAPLPADFRLDVRQIASFVKSIKFEVGLILRRLHQFA